MKLRILLLCLAMLPTLASAEIYKWKDKDGKLRYSDVPPPSNVKLENIPYKKTAKPTGQPALAPVAGDATVALKKDLATSAKEKQATDKAPADKGADKNKVVAPLSASDEAATKRAKDAEAQKKSDEAKLAELKLKQENCTAAKANLANLTNGGRISRTNEKGEREYLSNADISTGKADAQKDVDKYCE